MPLDLQGLDSDGVAPESRIKNYEEATRLFKVLEEADRIPARNRAYVHGLIAGDPPRNQAEMDKAGYGDFANFNSLKALADRDQAVTAFVGISDTTTNLISVKTRFGDPSQRPDWEDAIAEEYTWLLRKRWSSFYDREMMKATGLVSDGLALAYWPDPEDWRSEVGKVGQFLFPSNASTDVGKWKLVLQIEHVDVTELYERVKKYDSLDPKDQATCGLNRAAFVKAIQDACKADTNIDTAYHGDALEYMRNNDLCAASKAQEMRLVHYWVTEYEGKVSHYVGRADGQGPDFLEEHRNRYEEMSQCFALYADGIGEGKIRSLQGIIWRAYDDYLAHDQLRCDAFNAATMACRQLVNVGRTAQEREEAAEINWGPVTFLPPGMTLSETQFSASALGPIMEMLNEGNANIANNTGGYASHDFSPEGSEGRTATEASLQASNNAQIAGAKGINFSRSSEVFHRNTFFRLNKKDYFSKAAGWKERQDMLNRLTARGVPLEAFYEVYEVDYVRPMGLGSPITQQAAFAFLERKRAFLDPTGQRAVDRAEGMAVGISGSELDGYLPKLDVPRATPDQIIAPLENAGFGPGAQIPVYENQDSYVHLPIHITWLGEQQQLLQQGALDLRTVVGKLGPAFDHIQLHLKACTDPNRKDQVKGWQQAFDAATKAFGAMQQQLQSQPQPGAPTITKPIELLTAMGSALKDGAPIPNEDFGQVLQAAGINSQIPPTAAQPPVDPSIALDAQKAQAEIQRNNAVAQAEIDRKNALAQQQLAHKDIQKQSDILDSAQPQEPQLPTPSAPVYPQAV